MPTLTDCYLRRTSKEEQLLYDHLLYCVQTESPADLIERFRRLFIGGRDYKPLEVRVALEEIACQKSADQNFKLILNRCCHILIHRWQTQLSSRLAIPELVEVFRFIPPVGTVHSRAARRLRQLLWDFRETEQYLTLQRLARVIQHTQEERGKLRPIQVRDGEHLIGTLINRYPYLYEHCLLSQDSSYEHQQTVRQIRDRIQKQFELDLSQFAMYQVRSQQTENRGRIIQPVQNPTLLRDRALQTALHQFVGPVQGDNTHRDLANSFLKHSLRASSFRLFKQDLYDYLVDFIDPKYGKRQFNDRLYQQLSGILERYDNQKPNYTLLLRTSSHLLNFLVVESLQRINHYVFVDLVTNLGPTATVILLLKLTLLCKQVKPYLEKRFSILFSHYESSTEAEVPWLVKSMENLHIAFSLHFGSIDVSYLNRLL